MARHELDALELRRSVKVCQLLILRESRRGGMLRGLDASAHRSLTNMQRLAAPIARLGEDLSGDW